DALSRLVANGSINQLPLHSLCAAVSVGIHSGTPIIDLPYVEDSTAEVDMNVVMLAPLAGGTARFVEVQGTAEGQAFTREQLDVLLALAEGGLAQVFDRQRSIIATPPPPRA
ncbi:MAG: ribonuclease PH, partial [Actinomycetota bacterium]